MKRRDLIVAGATSTALLLASCGSNRPQAIVDHIVVEKGKRKMTLYSQGKEIKQYNIHLGFAPTGHKQFEGDGKTPEGRYYISGRNPRSAFHLSLEISYPNQADAAYADSYNKSPGGDIFIHGGPRQVQSMNKKDWTAGCIAVTDKEVEEIYALVLDNAIIDIRA